MAYALSVRVGATNGVGSEGRRDREVDSRDRGKSICRGERNDGDEGGEKVGGGDKGGSDDIYGRAKTPSSTRVGDGGATRLERRFKSSDGLGPFTSVARGARGFGSLEHGTAVHGLDVNPVLFEGGVVDVALGSLTI